jgi:hypothetical protein
MTIGGETASAGGQGTINASRPPVPEFPVDGEGAERGMQEDSKGEQIMAKGQMRSNKEVRKPKKDKKAAPAPTPFGAQVKQANEAASKKK